MYHKIMTQFRIDDTWKYALCVKHNGKYRKLAGSEHK